MRYSILLFAIALINSLGLIDKNAAISAPKDDRFLNLELTQNTDRDIAKNLANSYLNKTPITIDITKMSMEQALRIRNDFIQYIMTIYGKPLGYKVALTNQKIQERFNASSPLYGVFMEKMLLQNNSKIPANFGIKPRLEGDLMVRVGSEKINTAKNAQEVLASIDAVIPYIELPDIAYGDNVKLNALSLVIINAGARLGVRGDEIPLSATPEWEKKLGKIQVIITDQTGQELARGESSALLGHPLNVVMWLRDNLKAEGKYLKKGDLISLGSMTSLLTITSGSKIRAKYLGLNDKPIELNINFD